MSHLKLRPFVSIAFTWLLWNLTLTSTSICFAVLSFQFPVTIEMSRGVHRCSILGQSPGQTNPVDRRMEAEMSG